MLFAGDDEVSKLMHNMLTWVGSSKSQASESIIDACLTALKTALLGLLDLCSFNMVLSTAEPASVGTPTALHHGIAP